MRPLILLVLLASFTCSLRAQHWQLGSHTNGITGVTSVPSTSSFVTIGNDGLLHAWSQRNGTLGKTLSLSDPPMQVGSYFMPMLYARTDSALILVVTAQRITAVAADLSAVVWTLDLEPGTIQDVGIAPVITDTVIYQDQFVATSMFDLRTAMRTTVATRGVPQPALGSCIRIVADSVFRINYADGMVLDTIVMPKTIKAYDVSADGTLMAIATEEMTYVVTGDSLVVIDSIALPNYFGEIVSLSPSGMRVLNGRGILWDRTRKTKLSLDNDDAAPSSDLLAHTAWSTSEDVMCGVSKLPCNDGMACKGGWMTMFTTSNGKILANPVGTVGASFDVSITDDGTYAVLASTGLISVRGIVDGHVRLNRWPHATSILGGTTAPMADYGLYVQYDTATGSTVPLAVQTLLAETESQATVDHTVAPGSPVTPRTIAAQTTFTSNAQYVVDILDGTLRVVNVRTATPSGLSVEGRSVIRTSVAGVALLNGRSTVSLVDCTSLQIAGGFTLADSIESISHVRGTAWLCATTATQCFLYDMKASKMIDTVSRPVVGSSLPLQSKRFIAKTGVYIDVRPVPSDEHPIANEVIGIRLRDGVVIRTGDTLAMDVADIAISPNGFAVLAVASDGRVMVVPGFTDVDTIAVDTTTSTSITGGTVADNVTIAVVDRTLHVASADASELHVEVVDPLGRLLRRTTGTDISINLAAFPHQAFYVRVIGRTRTWTQAIITPL